MRFTESNDGKLRATLIIRMRLDREELDLVAAKANHEGLSIKEFLAMCLEHGLEQNLNE